MSAAAASRNPSLLAILLIAQGRTGSGAQLVFHYPPDPLSADRVSDSTSSGDEDDGESSSSDSEDSSSDDDFELFTKRLNAVTNNDNRSQASDEEDGDYLAKRRTQDDGDWKAPWEPLLGLGEDGLVSLLTPGRAWHKRRFELGINDLTFLGRPVYAREDGFWRKPKIRRPKSHQDGTSQQSSDGGASESENDDEVEENGTSNTQPADENQKQKDNIKEPTKTQLTMFHAVFVMDPPLLEHSFRVKEMYDHVVKKFSKVLKFEQSRHDYVWEQSELLHSIKSSHLQQRSPTKALYTEMLRRSSLAAAIAKVFDNISASKIAAITLSSKSSTSLQIPPVTSTSYLPSLTEPLLEPGLWLTTATDPASTESDLDVTASSGALQLSKNFTLLLKRSPQNILKDIQAAGGPLAVPLANFIAKAKPTKSFYKISVATGLPLPDVTHLARHLVYWRRAIAIPPLHQRDTYIVSPNANMNKLAAACKSYEANFPMMPSLPKMLNALSGTPAPYGSLIPSSDHKEEYYRALAWLMRDGWVTQLRTFAFVKVDPEVKKAVRDKERDEAKGTWTPIERDAPKNSPDLARSFGSGTPTTVASSIPSTFRQRPQRPSMVSRPSSDGRQSISTDHTSSRATQQLKHNPKAASLILSPQRASPEESRWLDYIASTLTAAHDKAAPDLSELPASDAETIELRRYWSIFVKYFIGTEALEKIPVREGLKRKFVWDVLVKIGVDFDAGVENVKGENKKVLVTIRHW